MRVAQVARYQPQRLFAEHEAVRTFHGLEPLTGLPVLIYKFAGRPTARVGELKSEGIPTILTSSVEGGRGQLVVAYARGYEPLQEPVQPHDVAALLQGSVTALYDAARASVVHGDLHPARFLKANDHVMLEGYGVPWAAWESVSEFSAPERIGGASAKGDIFSWASSVRFLAGRHLPENVKDLLTACLDAEPKNRPNAETLYKQIVQLDEDEVPPATPFDDLDFGAEDEETFSSNPFSLSEGGPAHREERETRQASSTRDAAARHPDGAKVYPARRAERSDVEATDADLFSSIPFDFGDDADMRAPPGKATGRRAALLFALLVCLLVLGALALFNRDSVSAALGSATQAARNTAFGEEVGVALGSLTRPLRGGAAPRSDAYLVNVEVVPANVQASLFVVESPEGSALPLERPVSIVPGSAVLDRAGMWRLQAELEGRRSDVQIIRIPDERDVTFTLPWAAAPTPSEP